MESKLSKFIYFLIHSNIYLSFGALFLSFIPIVLLNLQLRYEPLLIIFSTTFFLYNLNRKTDISEDIINYPSRVDFLSKHGNLLLWFSFLLYILGIVLAILDGIYTLIIALIPTFIMLFYSVLRLKKTFIIKNLIASFGWATMTFLVVKYCGTSLINLSVISIFIFIFLRLFINTVIFDIRDVKGDKSSGIFTIPIKIGIGNTQKILHIINFLSFLFLFLLTFFLELNPVGFLVAMIAFMYGFFCISKINFMNITKLCEIVDGEMIILGLFCIIGMIII